MCRHGGRHDDGRMDTDGRDEAPGSPGSAAEDEGAEEGLGDLGVDDNFQGCVSQLTQALLQPLPVKVSLLVISRAP